MVKLTIHRLLAGGFLLPGLILLVAQAGCSLPAGKSVPTYPGLSGNSPYQANYPPAGQVFYGAPVNATPNTPLYGQWNQSGVQPSLQSGRLRSLNPLGFSGQTC